MTIKLEVVPLKFIYKKKDNPWKKISFNLMKTLNSDVKYIPSEIGVTGVFAENVTNEDLKNKTTYVVELAPSEGRYASSSNFELVSIKEKVDIDINKFNDNEKFLFLRHVKFPVKASLMIVKDIEDFNIFIDGKISQEDFIEKFVSYPNIGESGLKTIFENLKNLNSEDYKMIQVRDLFEDYDVTDNQILKIVKHYSKVDKIASVIKDDFFDGLMKVNGLTQGKVDKIYLSNKQHKLTDYVRQRVIVKNLLNEQFKESKSWVNTNELFDLLFGTLLREGEQTKEELIKLFRDTVSKLIKDGIIVATVHLNKEGKKENRYSLTTIFNFEKNANLKLKEIAETKLEESDEEKAFDAFGFNNDTRIISEEDINKGIEQAEKIQKFDFTEEQKEAIRKVINSKVSSITGYAGTGKSSITRAINIIFRNSGLNVQQAVFTGRASDSLSESTGYPAVTVHSYLGMNGTESDEDLIESFANNKDYRFGQGENPDVMIIDEYSTLSIIYFATLLSTLHNSTRLIVIGDTDQLPALDFSTSQIVDNVDYINKITLTEVKRQTEKSNILKHSLIVRKANLPVEVANSDGKTINLKDLHYLFTQTKSIAINRALKIFNFLIEKGVPLKDITILSPMNNINHEINLVIQQKVLKFEDKKSFAIGFNLANKVHKGELTINVKNNTKAKDKNGNGMSVFNGNVGTVKDIITVSEDVSPFSDKKKNVTYMLVDFGRLGTMKIKENSSEAKNLELAYAMTTHKAQGSSIKYVIAILTDLGYETNLVSKQMLYTMMTRASKQLFVITNKKTMKKAIANSIESQTRNDFDILNSEYRLVDKNTI